MIGSFLTRGLVMVLGYAYPAYECYKTVEKNKPEIEQLLFWCQYWILVAFLTVCERVGDAFISWIPMYGEVKLLFFIYLWHPKMKGTSYVYDSFFKPYLSKHENEIDRNLMELRARAGDMAVVYWQRAASYGQTRIFDILQYVAAQSTPRPHQAQPSQRGGRARQPVAPPPEPEEPPSPTSSTSSSQYQKEIAEELASSEPPKVATQTIPSSSTQNQVSGPNPKTQPASGPNPKTQPASGPSARPPQVAPVVANYQAATAASNAKNQAVAVASSALKVSVSEKSTQSAPAELEAIETDGVVVSESEIENGGGGPTDTVMEDSIRVTRARLRKTRSTTSQK